MTTLDVQKLAKQFGGRKVVKDVSLQVQSGEIVGLLGPNGAGKTTCFYMILGLIHADGGTTFIDTLNISHSPMHERARIGIGYLPQEASVFRKLSVEDNILAIIETRHDLDAFNRQELLESLLDDFHIQSIRKSLGMSLSGGERRRVEIARALSTDPRFILLDEPFAGVDPISIIDIQAIIKGLAERGIGVLITDHNVRETLNVCQHAYIVNEGAVIASGTPEAILADEKVLQVYLGQDFQL